MGDQAEGANQDRERVKRRSNSRQVRVQAAGSGVRMQEHRSGAHGTNTKAKSRSTDRA